MEIERIKTALNKLIELEIKHSKNPFYHQDLEGIKKELNQPEEPQGYQGLNKWYCTINDSVIYAVGLNEFNSYGVRSSNNKWCDNFALQISNIKRLATPSEIQSAILKGLPMKGDTLNLCYLKTVAME